MTGFDQSDHERLREMEARIAAQNEKAPETAPDAEERKQEARAGRVGYEFLGAVLACLGLGYLVDEQAGSMPVGVIAGLFIGFAAGIANAWRAANGVDRAVGLRQEDKPAEDSPAAKRDEKEGH